MVHSAAQKKAVTKRASEEEPLRGQAKVFGIWGDSIGESFIQQIF